MLLMIRQVFVSGEAAGDVFDFEIAVVIEIPTLEVIRPMAADRVVGLVSRTLVALATAKIR
jgi:hypothetical protein